MVSVNREVTERRAMENIKFNIKMLCAYMDCSLEALAEKAGINPQHLYDVSSGRVRMTADDIVKLSAVTGIPADKIEY